VGVTQLRDEATKDGLFDCIQIKGLWIRARAALRGRRATDTNAT
jgi:hypothetical protein